MAKEIAFYQHCIKKLLSRYESWKTDWAEAEVIFDDKRMRYIVMRIGWHKHKYIHHCIAHINICDGKIVIQENNTEDLLATELEGMGIPKDKITLGFIPPEAQKYLQQESQQPLVEELAYA